MSRPRTHRATTPRPERGRQPINPVALHRKAGASDKFFSFFTVALTTGATVAAQQRARTK